ncbi:putative carboxylesterase nap [Phaeobacter sp. CECT 5382]|uniref:alpha/beta fold hydrolase n=1 Tax=Phaeobacter sp. CECT 5382 TaxID=1712645 RepID=UPI0006DAE01A|nr:alpha/beta fold hydrolase [Phaeobacter sp. CECT 5382]CUH88785.1 putative carboxylesterase nap [Phaeobacter sp. CECT 5382]
MSALSSLALMALAAPAALLGAAHIKTRKLAREAAALVPPTGQFCDTARGRIHYIDIGPRDAQPLVMIHGLSGQLQHFTYALTGRLAQDYRIIALDRPGCGYSTRPSDSMARLPEQAQALLDCLDQLGIANPLLVGHSLGGAVALAMALQAPEKIRGLALLAPLTHPSPQGADAFKGLIVHSSLMRHLMAQTVAVPTAQRTAASVLNQIFAPELCPDDFLIKAGGALGLRPQSFVAASADASFLYPAIDQQAARYAQELKTPGRVLFGDADAILDAKAQGHVMEAFGLPCQIVPGRGHMLPINAPDICESFIRDTLENLPT